MIFFAEWKLKLGRVEVYLDKEPSLCILWLNSIDCYREGFLPFGPPGDQEPEGNSGSSIVRHNRESCNTELRRCKMSKWLSVLSLAVMLSLVNGGFGVTEAWSIPQGACCYPDGSCADLLDSADCESQGGAYMGDGTACFAVECPAQPQGACCYADGSCADDQYQAQCEADGGTYMGDLTSCAQVECDPQGQGACCYPDGSCGDDMTRTECSGQGGVYMGDGTACFEVECDTDVKDQTGDREKPPRFALFQNHPNPFNQATRIEFTLAKSGFVNLRIYDLLGRAVRTLASEHLSSGYKSVLWDGKNDFGKDVASGIYFYKLRAEDYSATKALVLLK